jgi:hypothetical protein
LEFGSQCVFHIKKPVKIIVEKDSVVDIFFVVGKPKERIET